MFDIKVCDWIKDMLMYYGDAYRTIEVCNHGDVSRNTKHTTPLFTKHFIAVR